jgi:hypothetical protein
MKVTAYNVIANHLKEGTHMSHTDHIEEVTEQVTKILPRQLASLVEVLSTLRKLLRRIAVIGQVVLAVLGLIFAIYHFREWQKRSTELSERIEASLAAKLDNTVWQHKGLGAYLLGRIEPESDRSDPKDTVMVMEIKDRITEIAKLVDKQRSEVEKPREQEPSASDAEENRRVELGVKEVKRLVEAVVATEPSDPKSTPTPNLTPTPTPTYSVAVPNPLRLELINDPSIKTKGAPTSQAIIAGDKDFFLFLPVTALRRKGLTYTLLDENDPKGLKEALAYNPDIVLDLILGAQLVNQMKALDLQELNRRPVIQAYFITESGLMLIRSNGKPDQRSFYEKLFQKHYNFTDRAYFWEAVSELKKRPSEQTNPPYQLDYVSEPYIDLGGHGLVRTYSKAFRLANGRYGVLCLDAREDRLRAAVESRLEALQPDDSTKTYQPATLNINEEGVVKEDLPEDFQWFADRLGREKANQAGLLGRIVSQDSSNDQVLRYTIPWKTTMTDNKSRNVELMLVRIDLNRFWSKQNWRIVYMCVGLMVFLAVTLNIFQDYLLLKKQISELAKTVDRVMTYATNPYVRLNSDNEFEEINDSFLELLEYYNKDDLVGTSSRRTFWSLLDSDSERKYKQILKASASGMPATEYSINLSKKGDRGNVRVLVYGESIDFPEIRKEKYPHRFGIVLSAHEVDENGLERPIELGKKVREKLENALTQGTKLSQPDA